MKRAAAPRSVVNLRRAYFECRYGQLHVRTAFPSTGGFDENAPLLLLHAAPRTSRTLVPLMTAMGRDRSVYAADTPGYGESDPSPTRPLIADYAQAIGDFLDNLRLRRLDVLGHHAGAAIAAELAIQRPTAVRRLVCIGVPVHTTAEREAFARHPEPRAAEAAGAHVLPEWQRAIATEGTGASIGQVSAAFADSMRAGPNGWWGAGAVHQWPAHERLPLVTQPTLVLRPKDALWESTLRAQRLLKHSEWQDLPAEGAGALETSAEALATRIRTFLDR